MPHAKLSHHHHRFLSDHHAVNERRTWIVIALTLVTMVVEVIAGITFGSMALLADGWHMASHASAMTITAFAYYLSRRHLTNEKFTFGTGKIGDLGGFSSALVLGLIACLMAYHATIRLFNPVAISFDEAIVVAVVGLVVNLASAFILQDHHDHGADASHDHHHHQDHNLRAAYLHVLADALTSILAIAALVIGRFWGWVMLDPLMGIVGAMIICFWAYGLLRDTAYVLLDADAHPHLSMDIQHAIQAQDPHCDIQDLHVWQVGPGHYSAILSLISVNGSTAADFKIRLSDLEDLSHVTVEVHGPGDVPPAA